MGWPCPYDKLLSGGKSRKKSVLVYESGQGEDEDDRIRVDNAAVFLDFLFGLDGFEFAVTCGLAHGWPVHYIRRMFHCSTNRVMEVKLRLESEWLEFEEQRRVALEEAQADEERIQDLS